MCLGGEERNRKVCVKKINGGFSGERKRNREKDSGGRIRVCRRKRRLGMCTLNGPHITI